MWMPPRPAETRFFMQLVMYNEKVNYIGHFSSDFLVMYDMEGAVEELIWHERHNY